ncbi:MAG: type II secretion system F family protein [Phycisphaerae bacterium]|nr:MAG: type II secretion system F family protein [Phycisphaerae bacterium]MBE7458254.1 type II secretion system F family protein [Planctomycetia bacterium]MCQ3922083.1 type II secretion system F family protein [Planctomycetota bacterium]MCK6466109.1 type II secretion system F family protein [Phycisphaerae bacterium]MCL4718710.1 type II secretion system F family protein [Phycisphaerae bacterium]
MATYAFEAMSQSGEDVKDEVEAISTEDALAKIRQMGYFPTRIKEKGGKKGAAAAGTKKKRSGGGIGRVSNKQMVQFTRQLSTLQDAGLPILRSLNILEEQARPGKLKSTLRIVVEDIEGGATLSEAMAKHPKVFTRLYTNMIAAGETGGVLDVILNRLADFLEKAQKLKRKVIGAMIYPLVVITFACAIVGGIMYWVIPKFRDIFEDFDVELPALTEALISVSYWFANGRPPGVVLVPLIPIVFFMTLKLVRSAKGGRYVTDWLVMHIPIIGPLLEKSAIARFTRTLGTLISAGVPILEALNITKETAGNEVFARAMETVHDAIREGDSFANPLRATKTCDAIVVNMVDVGEETGELDKMLIKVADNYDEEVETAVASLISLLEPVMVVVLGGIVGFIVVALFLPLVKLIESVAG